MGKIVVTGGAGFIGRHLIEHLALAHNVIVLDDAKKDRMLSVPVRRENLKQYNILDTSALSYHFTGADTVYHLAAFTSVPRSVEEPLECYRQNLVGTHNVLDAAVKARVKRVIFASSAAVYGDASSPNREGREGKITAPYAISKKAAEELMRGYSSRLETISLRFFNVYGPRQREDDAYAAVIPKFRAKILEGKPVTIYGDGEQTRDFIHVSDVVRALTLANDTLNVSPNHDDPLSGKVFNIASGKTITVNRLALLMHEIAGREPNIENKPERAGDLRHSYADVEQARVRLGFKAGITLEQGLETLLGPPRQQQLA
jgi:nucleoside-diphosphate-sugar epimerase